jgi:hypothetical protein
MSRERMKNKKKTKPSKLLKESGSPNAGQPLNGRSSATGEGPSTTVRTWLSIWVVVHLMAITVSFTAVVQPSSLHQRLSEVLQPYLRPTHFSADDRPVYLTHGDTDDQPHRIEVTTDRVTGVATSGSLKWRVIGPAQRGGFVSTPGLAVSDRVARWLSTAAMLAENDQPSLVADLLLPVVTNESSIQGVRIVRYPTDLNDINSGVTVPYLARVVRDQDRVSLVQLKESRLSAQPRLSAFRPEHTQAVIQAAWSGEMTDALAGPPTAYHASANHLVGAELGQ